jgi:Na+/proline symporter
LTWLNFSFDPAQPFTFWAGLVGGAFLTMASHGADQMMVQRYLCSRSLAGARLALVGSGFVVLGQFLLFLLIGVGLFVLHQQGTLALENGLPNDAVFGRFIVSYLPVGIVGVLVAAVLAASMSSLASSLSSASSAFIGDFYRPLRPGRTETHYLAVSRGMTSLWGLSRIAVALVGVSLLRDRSVVNAVLGIAGLTTGVILGLFLLGSLRRPVASRAALVGLAVGFSAVLAVSQLTALAWPWYAPIGTLATVAVAWLVNLSEWAHGPLADRGTQPRLDEPGRADAVAARPADER